MLSLRGKRRGKWSILRNRIKAKQRGFWNSISGVCVCAQASHLLLNLVWFGVQHSWVPLVSCCPLGCPLPGLFSTLLFCFFVVFFLALRKKRGFIHSRSLSFSFNACGRNHFDCGFVGFCNHGQRCMLMIYDLALFLLAAMWSQWSFGTINSLRDSSLLAKSKTMGTFWHFPCVRIFFLISKLWLKLKLYVSQTLGATIHGSRPCR